MYKYNILKYLRELPVNDYRQFSRSLPSMLNVSQSTLKRWLYLKKEHPGEIPVSKLKQIADILSITINDLIN